MGRGRMDLAIEYKQQIFIIEIKLIRSYNSKEEIAEEGLRQISRYRDSVDSMAPAYLVIFDRRNASKAKSWDERLTWETAGSVTVIGC